MHCVKYILVQHRQEGRVWGAIKYSIAEGTICVQRDCESPGLLSVDGCVVVTQLLPVARDGPIQDEELLLKPLQLLQVS